MSAKDWCELHECLKRSEQIDALVGTIPSAAKYKEQDRLVPVYRKMVEASPFAVVSTIHADGVDCSPRGDSPQVVHVLDDTTLAIPQRAGNNRVDTLYNLLNDSRIGLLFLLPGLGETLRIRGHGVITQDQDLLARFTQRGRAPQCVILIDIKRVYFQCANSVVRSRLWSEAKAVDLDSKRILDALKPQT